MPEAKEPAKPKPDGPGAAPVSPDGGDRVPLRQLWPIPVLVLGAGLCIAGVMSLRGPREAPDPSLVLVEAERLVEAGRHQDAIETLNGPALAFIESGEATPEQSRRFLIARARAFAAAQATLGVSVEHNHRVVIDDYTRAERLGGDLPAEDTIRLTESLIALGEVDKALSRIGSLGSDHRSQRLRLTRRLIERNLAARDRREALTLDLLAALSTDPDISPDDRAWVLVRQSELLVSLGRVEEAITKLLREIQRLHDVPTDRQGEIYVLLGKAYFEAGQPENAARQLEAAEEMLDRSSLLRADAAQLLGRIAQNRGPQGHDQAREKFMLVVTEFRASPAYLGAVLGLAELDAAVGDHDRSLERYSEVIQEVRAGDAPREITRELVAESLLSRHRERVEAAKAATDTPLGDPAELRTSLRYAHMAETLFGERETPAALLVALASTHRRLADQALELARQSGPPDFSVRDLDPVARAEVKRHYLAAGEHFRRHAEEMAAADPSAYAESLWTAADSYERAGDLDEARKSFSVYVDSSGDTDPNRPAARFRLAQIFQAQGEFAAATALYEELRARAHNPGQPQTAGTWADRSIVPLAMCYLADADTENDNRAETLLRSVVDGSLLSPDARDYREALIQLGNMYYAAGRYPDAIARFEEVIERYGEQVDGRSEAAGAAVEFKLADSHRLESQRIEQTLSAALPQSVEDELRTRRTEHLAAAVRLYDQVRQRLEAADPERLTELDRMLLRNAYFYAGDCAFDMGDYVRAVAAYDAAALKYADDPASLVAMAQIVSAYVAQGQWAQARTANERARRQLARFPDEVWTRPGLPMEKRHWERWLDARTLLERSAAAPTP